MTNNKPWRPIFFNYFAEMTNLIITGDQAELQKFFYFPSNSEHILEKIKREKEVRTERFHSILKNQLKVRILNEIVHENFVVIEANVQYFKLLKAKEEIWETEEVEPHRIELVDTKNGWLINKDEIINNLAQFKQNAEEEEEGINSELLTRYDRIKAVKYAELWWNGANPRFLKFEDDCTNFISQSLWAGNAPMTYSSSLAKGWWYKGNGASSDRWSYSWAVANSLRWYLATKHNGLSATIVDSPFSLQLGDVITYDFDGDGKWQHNTIVTDFDPLGNPLVNAHTYNARKRFWDYHDSLAWTPKIQYSFFHINDEFK